MEFTLKTFPEVMIYLKLPCSWITKSQVTALLFIQLLFVKLPEMKIYGFFQCGFMNSGNLITVHTVHLLRRKYMKSTSESEIVIHCSHQEKHGIDIVR